MGNGSWELKARKQVLVGILHTDQVTLSWAFGLRNLQVPGEILPVAGMPFDHARNAVCQAALDNGYQYVFFLDSDVAPPNDTIPRLMSHRLPLVSGVYHRRSPPHGVPVMQRPVGRWVTSYPANSLIEVDVVGTGCLLIHRSILEQMPPLDARRGKRWFDWKVDMPGLPQGEALSEDFAFNMHLKRTLGIKTMVDTSVICRHIGLSQATYGSMLPLEVHTHT